MVTLEEMLKKRVEINQRIKDWGFTNPRLFKGIIIKSENYLRDESHLLNILVDEINDEIPSSNKRMLELDLEKLLTGCKVVVSLKDDFNEESAYKVDEAVSLDNQTALSQYFGLGWQFTELKLNEQELAAQQLAYENLEFIKNSIKLQIRKKRTRQEEDNDANKTQPSQEEIAEIEKIEREVEGLSPRARDELLARMQKYKEPKLTTPTPTSTPITGLS